MKPLYFAVFALLCALSCRAAELTIVSVRDPRGAALSGVIVLPMPEIVTGCVPYYSPKELLARTTGKDGSVRLPITEYLWSSDNYYHFSLGKAGFKRAELVIPKDKFDGVISAHLEKSEGAN